MISLLLASFFYADVIYRLPMGSYGYVLASDVLSWGVIFWALLRGVAGRARLGRLSMTEIFPLALNLLMFLLLFQVYFEAQRVFSELGRAAADTLRFSQYILTALAVRACLKTSLKTQRFLIWVFVLGVGAALFGLVSDVILHIPRSYAGITHDVLRPREFSSFFTNNRGCAAVYLLVAIAIGFGLLLRRGTPLRKVLILAALAVLAVALVFSRSRSGIVGLIVALLFFLYYDMRYRGRDLGSFAGLAAMVAILGGAVLLALSTQTVMDRMGIGDLVGTARTEARADRMHSRERKVAALSVRSRLENWRHSLQVIKEMDYHLPFGYGVNQQGARIGMGGAHNNYLQVIIDLGLVGLGLFLVFLRSLFRILRRPPEGQVLGNPHQAMRLGLRCGLWGLLATTLSQETFYMAPAMGNFFGFFLVLLAIVQRLPETDAPAEAGVEEGGYAGESAYLVRC
jgi:O-antigen ligase